MCAFNLHKTAKSRGENPAVIEAHRLTHKWGAATRLVGGCFTADEMLGSFVRLFEVEPERLTFASWDSRPDRLDGCHHAALTLEHAVG